MENAENALVLLNDVCRLCLDEPGVENIFKPIDWTQDILTYTGVKVTAPDNLPQTICSSCRDIIACVKVLKNIARTNDKQLHLIKGSRDNQVLVTDSPSHLVILTPHTACNYQNESIESPDISSSPTNNSFKNKIVFESEDEGTESKSKPEKHKKKRKSSLPKTEIHNASKKIAVRKDLFDSSAIVTSSTKMSKRIKQPSTSSHSENSENSKIVTSPDRRCKESPTSTTDHRTTPMRIKTLTVSGRELKVFEYEYKCEICNKSYATHKKLYLHQLAHNKKFTCPLDACCKKFATKGDLQKHVRSHTGEKPYKCNLCDQSFTQNVSLKSHKEKIHTESHS